MIKRFAIFLRIVLLAVAVQFSLAGIADAQCLSPQQTKQAIKSKQVVSIRKAMSRAGLNKVRVVKADLCLPNYIVTVMDKKGRLSTHTIQAIR